MRMKMYQRQADVYYKEYIKSYRKILSEYLLANYGYKRKYKSRARKDFSKKIKQARLILQAFRCRHCFTYLDVYQFDHIDGNRSNNSIFNCQALCPTCHARKSKWEKSLGIW